MMIERGPRKTAALKVCIYGPEGIGKSTLASRFPGAVFEDTEGSTDHMDVARLPRARSWTELMRHVDDCLAHPEEIGAYILDTADWAERLCTEHLLAARQCKGIEDFGYGKGYVYLAEEFGKLLDKLSRLKDQGVHVVLTAHAAMRKFEQPDELGAYDRWELKLGKKTAPLVKEWADMLLFCNYKTIVVNVDNQGAAKGKNKAQGGRRVMYTAHHPCWDAKNRFGLPEEVPMAWESIAPLIRDTRASGTPLPSAVPENQSEKRAEGSPVGQVVSAADNSNASQDGRKNGPKAPVVPDGARAKPQTSVEAGGKRAEGPVVPDGRKNGVEDPLNALMAVNAVQPAEIQAAVAQKGYYTADTPISSYDPAFVSGVLIAAWPQVEAIVLQNRANVPF